MSQQAGPQRIHDNVKSGFCHQLPMPAAFSNDRWGPEFGDVHVKIHIVDEPLIQDVIGLQKLDEIHQNYMLGKVVAGGPEIDNRSGPCFLDRSLSGISVPVMPLSA